MKFTLVAPLALVCALSAYGQDESKTTSTSPKAANEAEAKATAEKSKADSKPLVIRETEDTNALKLHFNGTFSEGIRTMFGERSGQRVTEALTRFHGELYNSQPNNDKIPEFRAKFDALWGYSNNANNIVPDQSSAEHCEIKAAFGAFTYARQECDQEGWEIEFHHISADPGGLKNRDAVNIYPLVFEGSDGRGSAGRFAAGLRYEDQSFDSSYLAKIGSSDDRTEYNVGLYCEASGFFQSGGSYKTSGVFFEPKGSIFIRDMDTIERWSVGAAIGVPLLPERFGTNCRIALEIDYRDNNDPTGVQKFIGVTGVLPF